MPCCLNVVGDGRVNSYLLTVSGVEWPSVDQIMPRKLAEMVGPYAICRTSLSHECLCGYLYALNECARGRCHQCNVTPMFLEKTG